MVKPGEDASFLQIGFRILGVSDAFGVRDFDGHRSVEAIVVTKIDPAKPALT
jgi:hypothetical protein